MKHEEEWQIIVRRIREQETANSAAREARAAAAIELSEAALEYEAATYVNFRIAEDRYRTAITAYRLVRNVD